MGERITRRNLKNGIFAFIDLLGFSDRVKQIKTDEDLRKLDADVVFVQREFEHKSSDDFVRRSQKIVGKRVLAFSDCIVISVPLHSELAKLQGTFDVLMSELTSLAIAQGDCVQRGIFLRGGVDLGYWLHRKDTLISPAMVNAYGLEHEACVPMIAITPALYKYLSKHPDRGYYSKDIEPFSKVFKLYRKLPNGKTHWFINYLRICLESVEPVIVGDDRERYLSADADGRERMRTELWQSACSEWALSHGRIIAEAHAKATVASVRLKYEWLASYHNAEVKRFFGKRAKPLLIEENLSKPQRIGK
ncbi:hypothetical protein [Paracoccus versutus]|uniref:Uncharacterized protein n=1 Tax=Paracoccus versutus TaxID=34007 RepID=A0A3D9XJ50_PARVE|nr:hypothetical protein [Paracoccus versutus]REF70527.1 hypothetical protein BDD41_3268 [Paracoccus versutus]WGR57177.1 hypothetical protein E3U25_14255 [Paracoccus versutus]